VVSAPHATVAKADPFKSAKSNAKATPAAKSNSVKVVAAKNNAEDKKPLVAAVARSVGQAGRRDPFISPVVTMSATGSGCSSGKRCLAIDQIALRGIVRSDNGMIAVVVNATDKAYFLRENDPVFNGYVVKITGDSIVFKETFHDKLGKPLTRDITKTISRPVA
jgi:Tfp pilus assembly protein PilP